MSYSSGQASTFMPIQATEIAAKVDTLYGFLLVTSVIACILVIGGFIYFAVKYRRRSDNDKTAYITHNNTLEFLWSFIPFVIFMVVFAWGWWIFHDMRSFPKDSLEITVQAQKWDWSFVYKNGRRSVGEFYVPVNTPVKLVMTSKDVLHSFFVPSFRNKQDVVPGRYTAMWFHSKKVGSFQAFCTEYCGDKHSSMLAIVHVVPMEQYEEWLGNEPYKGLTLSEIGQKIYSSRCIACHTTTDQKNIGPGFAGLFMSERVFENGERRVADENYMRDSILNPMSQIVRGYPNAMPSFAGQLTEEELMGIIEYIKELKL